MSNVDKQSAPPEPPSTDAERARDWAIYKRLLRYVKPYWPLFILSLLGFSMGSAAEAYFVNLFGKLIDNWQNQTMEVALMIPLLMLGAAVVRGVGEIIGELLLSKISFGVVHRIRTQLFDQLLLMPSAYFDASTQGHLVSRLTYNVGQLRDTGTDALKSVIQDGGKVIVYLAYMLYLSWKLTLIFALTAPLVALVVVYASRRFRRISRRIQNSMGDVTHVASEAVSGYRVVRIFGGETYEQNRFHRSSDNNQRQNLKMVATKVTSTQIIQIFVAAALALLIALLLRPEVAGDLTTGQIVTLLGLAGMLARPIRKLSEVNARLQRGLAAAEDIFGQMDQPLETDQGSLDVERVTGRIEFRHLDFAYERGAGNVLHDINVVIEPGQTVALVGKSGSGKSTIASLIPRFYEPTAGEILLDGHPLNSYRLPALRRQIALVTQQVTLFNDTLERNIAYGTLADADPAAIRNAVERAHADTFIDALPDGLQTMVGDDGVLLSGGQRQRIAIARALLKDAPILILDEATSALDTESERHIQAALEEVMRGRTTLVIAHRLSTIERADLILVMEAGRILEAGTHTALLAREGAYANLYDAQFADAAERESARKPVVELPAPPAPAHESSTPVEWYRLPRPALMADAWYSGSSWIRLLTPFSWLFRWAADRRRLAYLAGRKPVWRAPVPVIVVGNITAGGTGKTPLVIWLVAYLRALGHTPGIVSRGHGGSANAQPLWVTSASDPLRAGDEPVLLAARTAAPVVVCRDRAAAARRLLQDSDCTIIIADDGLQHYALARDVEIAVLDGDRGIGNGLSLPAGPLREPVSRLATVDWVVANGSPTGLAPGEAVMRVRPGAFVNLVSGERIDCDTFVARRRQAGATRVHAVAGIGNPARFAETLAGLGLDPLLVSWPDHHRFNGAELRFGDDWPVICTEKDAVKLRLLGGLPGCAWYLEIDVEFADSALEAFAGVLRRHGIVRS